MRDSERRAFEPRDGAERLAALRLVLDSKAPAKIDGVFVEHHWARMILEVYDDLDPEARRQLADTPVTRIPDLMVRWAKGRKARPGSERPTS
ncbi:MAG TPA: hypothetical protein VIA61_09100 [Methylomirabilota bacterium]